MNVLDAMVNYKIQVSESLSIESTFQSFFKWNVQNHFKTQIKTYLVYKNYWDQQLIEKRTDFNTATRKTWQTA